MKAAALKRLGELRDAADRLALLLDLADVDLAGALVARAVVAVDGAAAEPARQAEALQAALVAPPEPRAVL